jgi:hypothetical protein
MAAWNKLKVNARLSAGQNLTILVPSQASRRVARNSPGNASKPKASAARQKQSSKPKR